MRILYVYGIISGGGCEKRMGDLVRWLCANGDDAWIVGTRINPWGRQQLFVQQKIASDRVFLYDPTSTEKGTPEGYAEYVRGICQMLGPDVLDFQYATDIEPPAGPRLVCTMHGTAQPVSTRTFDGMLSVERSPGNVLQYPRQIYAEINNWVDPERFRFRRKLGLGACFIGRTFKKVNAVKVAQHWDGTIDCYGLAEIEDEQFPQGLRWKGYVDPAQIMPFYRVVFGSAQVALEAIACGRLVIAGQHYMNVPGGLLVRMKNIRSLIDTQFYTHDKSGMGVEPTSEEVYAEFRWAMENDMALERWRLSRHVRKHHDMDRQIRKVRAFYEEVLAA